MSTILILSVGGSPEPVVNAIKKNKPAFVYFFCSSGARGSAATIDSHGEPCGEKRKTTCPECGHTYNLGTTGKSIASQAHLEKSRYEIITVDDPDDLDDCYEKLLLLTKQIEDIHGRDSRVIANYTGGTKTMSVAMFMVGLMSEKWDLAINIGRRTDLIKVRSGDIPIVVGKWRFFCETQLTSVRKSLKNFDYAQAHASITDMLSHPLEKNFRNQLVEAGQICQGFDLWDKFAHTEALGLLMPFGKRFSDYLIALKKILGQQRNSSGYEMMGDLLNNAARKAHRGYYDDAVGRLYRAVELFAQTRLQKQYGYKSSELKLADLPENLQKEYQSRIRDDNRLLLGLKEDYELLLKLDDPVGNQYAESRNRIINALIYRNNSIGAHGLEPLGEDDYLIVRETLAGFVETAAREIATDYRTPQFPQEGIL